MSVHLYVILVASCRHSLHFSARVLHVVCCSILQVDPGVLCAADDLLRHPVASSDMAFPRRDLRRHIRRVSSKPKRFCPNGSCWRIIVVFSGLCQLLSPSSATGMRSSHLMHQRLYVGVERKNACRLLMSPVFLLEKKKNDCGRNWPRFSLHARSATASPKPVGAGRKQRIRPEVSTRLQVATPVTYSSQDAPLLSDEKAVSNKIRSDCLSTAHSFCTFKRSETATGNTT